MTRREMKTTSSRYESERQIRAVFTFEGWEGGDGRRRRVTGANCKTSVNPPLGSERGGDLITVLSFGGLD